MMGTVRSVCRNVKRWRNAAIALRWTAAGMLEATKGFRRLKAHKHLPVLRAALAAVVGHDLIRDRIPLQYVAGLFAHNHGARLVYETIRHC
jgi:hypothetical protein